MKTTSHTLLSRAVRPLLESLETRRLFAVTVILTDLDDNGTLDLRIEGDNGDQDMKITDNDNLGFVLEFSDPSTTLFVDANKDGDFDDPGDFNGAVIDFTNGILGYDGVGGGPIETYDINLQGGDDRLEFLLGRTWNDSEKSILANLTYSDGLYGEADDDTFIFNANDYEIRNKTDLTIDLYTGQGHDTADIDFAKLNRALVNLNLDLGDPGTGSYPCDPQEMQGMAFEALDTNGAYGGGDEVRIDFNGDIGNWSTISVNVQYGEVSRGILYDNLYVDSAYLNVSSLTLIVFHKVIDNSDVEVNIEGASSGDIRSPALTDAVWLGSAVNIAGVLFRSDLKNDADVFINYNSGDGSVDLVGVGLDKGFDQRSKSELYINLQGGDEFDILAVATTNILSPVSLASGETNTVEWNSNTKFYYTLNLGDGGNRLLAATGDAGYVLTSEQAFVMLGYNFFNDGEDGPVSAGDSDPISAFVSAFLNDRDVRVHAGSKHRARLTGGNGDDDLYLGYGITNHSPTSTGNFDITVEGNNGYDYVAYAFDKAGGSNLTANNFKASGKALLDGGSQPLTAIWSQVAIARGDVLDIIVDDGKSRNRNFEINGSHPNL